MPKTWLDDAVEDALNIEFGEIDPEKIEWPEQTSTQSNGRASLTLGRKTMPKPEKTAEKQASAPAVREQRAALPKYEGGAVKVTPEQRDSLLAALCTDDTLVLSGAVNSAASCNPYEGENEDRQRNLALRLLVELAPQNPVERLLIQQLIAADMAASVCLSIGTHQTNDVNHRRKSMNLACQFMSVQARQIELLNKLRNGGQQRVVVEHISVEAGAQAVIGNVTRGEGGGNER